MSATCLAIPLSLIYNINVIDFRKRANVIGVTYYILWYKLGDFNAQTHKM